MTITQDTIDGLYRVELMSSMGLGFLLLIRRIMPDWASKVSPCDVIGMHRTGHCPSLLNLATGISAIAMVFSAALLCIASAYLAISTLVAAFNGSGDVKDAIPDAAVVYEEPSDSDEAEQPPPLPLTHHKRRVVMIRRVNCR